MFGPVRELGTTITVPNRENMRLTRTQSVIDDDSPSVRLYSRCRKIQCIDYGFPANGYEDLVTTHGFQFAVLLDLDHLVAAIT